MSRGEIVRKPVLAVAACAAAGLVINHELDKLHLPHLPGLHLGGTQEEVTRFNSESTLQNLTLSQDVTLVKGEGATTTELDADLKYTGLRSFLNVLPGRNMDTTVTETGELQMGLRAGGIRPAENADPDGAAPYTVKVDVSKIFTQIANEKKPQTNTDDGFIVNLRSPFHPEEAKDDERRDELEAYGRASFNNKCEPILQNVLGAGVVAWVRAQEQLKSSKRVVVKYVDPAGNPIDIGSFKLPTQPIAPPDQLLHTIYGNDGASAELKDFQDKACKITPQVARQIKQINHGNAPKPEV